MTLRLAGFCLLVLLPAVALAAAAPEAPAPAAPTTVAPAPAVPVTAEPTVAAPVTVEPTPVAPTPIAPTAVTPAPVEPKPVATAAAPPAAPKSPPPASWDSYRILSERNIFLRNRSRYSSNGRRSYTPSASTTTVSSGDSSLVLTGIIQQGEDCVAFFEDTRSGKTSQFRVGDALGRGRLSMITPDIVHYAYDGNLRRVEIGTTLAGAAVSFSKPATTSATTASATSSTPAAPGAVSAVAPAAAPGMPPGLPPGVVIGGGMAGPPGTEPFGPGPGAVMMTIETGGPVLQAAPSAGPTPPAPAVAGTTTPPPPAAPPQAAGGPSSGAGNAASIEERMRQRREQELNK